MEVEERMDREKEKKKRTYQMQVPTLPKSGGHLSLPTYGSRPPYRVDGEWVTRFNNTPLT